MLTSTINIGVNLTIEGPGASALVVSGNTRVEVIHVASAVTATVSGLTVENGSSAGIANDGTLTISNSIVSGTNGDGITNDGTLNITNSTLSDNTFPGIFNTGGTLRVTNSTVSDNGGSGIADNGGTLTVTNTTLSDNSATYGGGIENAGGTLFLTDSTLSGNSATFSIECNEYPEGGGGAIYNTSTATITNSTLVNNSATCTSGPDPSWGGGGIYNMEGTVDLQASILAKNVGGDCAGGVTDKGYNINDDAGCGFTSPSISDYTSLNTTLGPLAINGGPTQTIALLPSSPAIDYVPAVDCPATDQRGFVRTPPCDIGAYDTDNGTQPQTIVFTSTAPSDATVDGPMYGLTATGGGSGNPVVFSSATPSVCTVSGSEVSFVGVGTCTINANQAGNATYQPAPQVQQSFSVAEAAGACAPTVTRCFTSAAAAPATIGSSFSFSVTTSGTPSPKIKSHGKLPKGVKFHKGTGTATLSGTPTSTKHKSAAGTYNLTFTATFGKGKTKVVVTQAFTLTVTS